MRFPRLNLAAACGLALGLSACATYQPMIPGEVSYVDKVNVELKQGVAPHFAEAMRAKAKRESSRYGHAGTPKELRISVSEVHYKDAAMSLMFGDANRVAAHVAVLDAATGRSHGEFDETAIDNFAINGVVGAIVAASQNKEEADQRLAENLSSKVMEHIYGTAAAEVARKRAPVDYPEAAPAAAPASTAPGKPKSAPARKTDAKTAMATPVAAPEAR